MTTYRNYTLEEVEKDRIAYRRMPVHPMKTYSEVKAERRERMKVYQAFLIGCAVLAAVIVLLKMWVG